MVSVQDAFRDFNHTFSVWQKYPDPINKWSSFLSDDLFYDDKDEKLPQFFGEAEWGNYLSPEQICNAGRIINADDDCSIKSKCDSMFAPELQFSLDLGIKIKKEYEESTLSPEQIKAAEVNLDLLLNPDLLLNEDKDYPGLKTDCKTNLPPEQLCTSEEALELFINTDHDLPPAQLCTSEEALKMFIKQDHDELPPEDLCATEEALKLFIDQGHGINIKAENDNSLPTEFCDPDSLKMSNLLFNSYPECTIKSECENNMDPSMDHNLICGSPNEFFTAFQYLSNFEFDKDSTYFNDLDEGSSSGGEQQFDEKLLLKNRYDEAECIVKDVFMSPDYEEIEVSQPTRPGAYADPIVTMMDHCYLKTTTATPEVNDGSKSKDAELLVPKKEHSPSPTPEVPVKRKVGRPRKTPIVPVSVPVKVASPPKGRRSKAKRFAPAKTSAPKRMKLQYTSKSKYDSSSSEEPEGKRSLHNMAERARRLDLKTNLFDVEKKVPDHVFQNTSVAIAAVKEVRTVEDIENRFTTDVLRKLEDISRSKSSPKKMVKHKKGKHWSKMVILLGTSYYIKHLKSQTELKYRCIRNLEHKRKCLIHMIRDNRKKDKRKKSSR